MANVNVEKQSGERAELTRAREGWDPFRAMREILRHEPFADVVAAPSWAERTPQAFVPAFEVSESKDAFEFHADMPGVDAANLEVKLTGNRLLVTGRREAKKADRGDTYYTYERAYGGFTRAFTLPDGADGDKIRAELKDGVLSVVVPKRPPAQATQVEIQRG
ncbi:MAG: Hsp20 family protein [Deltaproteobacteria bacterium]|nr:Hsp20 family protein [Deltaproteobacteria bacterium]